MADHHTLDTHHDLLAAFRTYLHRRGDPKLEARLETAKRFLAGRNGSNGPVSAEEVTGYLNGLSPTFRGDLKRFGVFLAERGRRRPDPARALERRIEELPPPAREPLLSFFHSLRCRNYAANTLRGYAGVLRGFALALPGVSESGWALVSREEVSRFIEAEQASGWKASTINVKLKILHGFYTFLMEQGLAATNPVRKGAYLKMPEALPRPMAVEDTRRFVSALEDLRDRAIFLVLLRTGMRVGELLAARVQDVDLASSSFTIPKGKKNRRGRVVYLSPEAHEALSAWLASARERPPSPSLQASGGELFPTTPSGSASRRSLPRRASSEPTGSTASGTPSPLRCWTPAFAWRCSSSSSATTIYRRPSATPGFPPRGGGRSTSTISPSLSLGETLMESSIRSFQSYLKRRNTSPNTWKSYTAHLRLFLRWCPKAPEAVTHQDIEAYVEHLQGRGLKAKTVNDYLGSLKQWFAYLQAEEGLPGPSPVKARYRLRQPRPLPRPLRREEVTRLFGVITRPRDRALFLMMLRCGLRVAEVAALELKDLDLRRRAVTVREAKGGRERMVYLSDEVLEALVAYLPERLPLRLGPVFLNEKGPWKGQGISIRGIQKLMEANARKSGVAATCHRLRHTFATELLNAEADLSAIQELLGHRWITTTQCYCRVSNVQVKRAYFRAVREIETKDRPSWLDPAPSWQLLTVGVHSLRRHLGP